MAGLTVTGDVRALAALASMARNWRFGLRDGAHLAGQILVRECQAGMQSAGGGRVYAGARRQASAPGGYPAIQSSQLYGSINYRVHGWRSLEFGSSGAFNNAFDYSIAVHEGTTKMAPRPYLVLTVEKTRDEITRVLGDATWRAMIGGG